VSLSTLSSEPENGHVPELEEMCQNLPKVSQSVEDKEEISVTSGPVRTDQATPTKIEIDVESSPRIIKSTVKIQKSLSEESE